MLAILRQMAIWALIVILSCGNGLNVAATAGEHHGAGTGHESGRTAVPHQHASHSHASRDHATHDHAIHDHDSLGHAAHAHQPTASSPGWDYGVSGCTPSNCATDEAPDAPCCHVHAYYCMSLVTLPSSEPQPARIRRASAIVIDAGAPIPLGAIFYPLLRPPRAAA